MTMYRFYRSKVCLVIQALLFMVAVMFISIPAVALLLPDGSFELCSQGCNTCAWECKGNYNYAEWITYPSSWGQEAYDGYTVGWLGGVSGDLIVENKFCVEIDYLNFNNIRWHWMAYIPENHQGNVIRASIDGVTVFERTLVWPDDHTWGTWNADITDDLDAFCDSPPQTFCIEIIPTDGASYFIDYFEEVGMCHPIGTEEMNFSTIKRLY